LYLFLISYSSYYQLSCRKCYMSFVLDACCCVVKCSCILQTFCRNKFCYFCFGSAFVVVGVCCWQAVALLHGGSCQTLWRFLCINFSVWTISFHPSLLRPKGSTLTLKFHLYVDMIFRSYLLIEFLVVSLKNINISLCVGVLLSFRCCWVLLGRIQGIHSGLWWPIPVRSTASITSWVLILIEI